MRSPRPLILTVACRYEPAAVAPFVESWKRHAGEAELVVFGGALPTATVEYLQDRGAQVIPAEFNLVSHVGWRKAWYRLAMVASLRCVRFATRVAGLQGKSDQVFDRIAEGALHLYSQRFVQYRRYLSAFGWRYSEVLLADIRDTLFQASPFPCRGLHVFAENETIGASHFARRWFQLTYGASVFRELRDRPHLCAGVVLGDLTSMQQYLDVNVREALRLLAVNDADQAIHNALVHRGLVPAEIHRFGDGVAINLNGLAREALKVHEGRLVDAAGKPYAVVHQYDRVRGLDLQA